MKKIALFAALLKLVACAPAPFIQLSPEIGAKQIVHKAGRFYYAVETIVKNSGKKILKLKILCVFGGTEKHWQVQLRPGEEKTLVYKYPASFSGVNVSCEYFKKGR